jgi:AbrB family looped-hinge helix DNA binding protein
LVRFARTFRIGQDFPAALAGAREAGEGMEDRVKTSKPALDEQRTLREPKSLAWGPQTWNNAEVRQPPKDKENAMLQSTVTTKGQTNVPVAIRELLEIKAGDRLEYVVDGSRIIVTVHHGARPRKGAAAGAKATASKRAGRPAKRPAKRRGGAR